MMGPFYPIKARSNGIEIVVIGWVIGSMAITATLSSFIVGKIMQSQGSHNEGKVQVILLACIFVIIQNAMLGYLEYESN